MHFFIHCSARQEDPDHAQEQTDSVMIDEVKAFAHCQLDTCQVSTVSQAAQEADPLVDPLLQ